MTFLGWLTIFLFVVILTALAMPLGRYMAAVYTGQLNFLRVPERCLYRVMRVDPAREQDWKAYAKSVILFSLAGWLLLYIILRTQTLWNFTGLNPQHFHSAPWNVTFNTTSSFVTNTNWQFYGGETTMTYFSQMVGLTVQNFLSAGVGIVVAVALIRGIIQHSGKSLGNFWQDLVRTVLYVLMPISFVVAMILVFQGSIQNFSSYLISHGLTHAGGQTIAMGPVASQEAIKELGTNGGGFFNVNSAHPFENPSGFTNFVEMLTVLVIPAALVFIYGRMVGKPPPGLRHLRHDDGDVPRRGHRRLHRRGPWLPGTARRRSPHPRHRRIRWGQHGGQGAAVRDRGVGTVRRRHHRHLLRGGQQRDRVVHGDRRRRADGQPVGQRGHLRRRRHRPVLDPPLRPAGRVHRRPDGRAHTRVPGQEDRGPGDQARRLGLLITPLAALFSTALGVASSAGRASISTNGVGPQGFSETFYAYLSQSNNNGSAFAGYTGFVQPNAGNLGSHGITFADLLGGFTMLFARFAPILFALAVAGTLAGKRVSPPGLGTMRTDNADLRGPADRRDHPRRRAHLLPRPASRTDRAGPHRTPLLVNP